MWRPEHLRSAKAFDRHVGRLAPFQPANRRLVDLPDFAGGSKGQILPFSFFAQK
jgi:hypothetical protein